MRPGQCHGGDRSTMVAKGMEYLCVQYADHFGKVRKKVDQLGDKVEDQKSQVKDAFLNENLIMRFSRFFSTAKV